MLEGMTHVRERTSGLWMLVGIILVATRSTCGQNLLANPSFEHTETRGGRQVPAGWDLWAYPDTTLEYTDRVAHAGKGSGLITVTPEGRGRVSAVLPAV